MQRKFSPFTYFFYGLTLLIVFSIQLFIDKFTITDLSFLLSPISQLVSLFTGLSFVFDVEQGYLATNNLIVIDKSCSGINFFLLTFSLLIFWFIRHFRNLLHQLLFFFTALVSTYLFTVLVNAFRITVAVKLLALKDALPWVDTDLFHLLEGILFYAFFLVGFYLLVQKLVGRYKVKKGFLK